MVVVLSYNCIVGHVYQSRFELESLKALPVAFWNSCSYMRTNCPEMNKEVANMQVLQSCTHILSSVNNVLILKSCRYFVPGKRLADL